ncbi:NAD(P)-binding protein [Leptospira sp. 96542]|nr:NAD(P)-binding protein [Leptospira sp. 96542]
MNQKVLIIGGGLTGLFHAYAENKKGNFVTIWEKSNQLGGLVSTKKVNEGLVELAANGILFTKNLKILLDDINLIPLSPNRESKRRLIWDGKKCQSIIFFALVLVFKFRSIFIRKISSKPGQNLYFFFEEYFGEWVTKFILEPAIGGIYGATLSDLSPKIVFSNWDFSGKKSIFQNIRISLKSKKGTISFQNGMGELVEKLEEHLKNKIHIEYNKSINHIDQIPKESGKIFFCIPLEEIKRILSPWLPLDIRPTTHSVTTITRFSKDRTTEKKAFGILFPRNTNISAFGMLQNSDIFAYRSNNNLNSETWIFPHVKKKPESEWLRFMEDDRKTIYPNSKEAENSYIKIWENTFPVYNNHLYDFNLFLDQFEKDHSQKNFSIMFNGNYRRGIGLSAILDRALS